MKLIHRFYRVFVLLGLVAITSCTSTPTATATTTPTPTPTPMVSPSSQYTINVATNSTGGTYLVDGNGMTLYYFTKDSVGVSTATGTTLANWPLFNSLTIVVPPSLNASDFGSITRADGLKVTTYKGWPLYYYIGDKAAGDMKGQGLGGVWFVVNPNNFPPASSTSTVPTIQYTVNVTTKAPIGIFLVDSKGMTLYYTTLDTASKSNITGATLAVWPAFNNSTIVIPSSLAASDFSSITRSDGAKQTTYKGWPMYYYSGDSAAGDTNGNGFGGVWFVMSPTSPSAPASTPSPTSTPPPYPY